MSSEGKWVSKLAHLYYITGAAYYLYEWLLALGFIGLITSGALWRLSTPILTANFLIISVVLIISGISFWRKYYAIRMVSHNPMLQINSITIDYRIDNDRESCCTRELDVKALYPVDMYQAVFYWTGQGKVSASPVKNIASVDTVANSHDICRVHFKETLPKGKKLNFAFKMKFFDATRPVRPFLGHSIDAPLKKLVLKVQLPSPQTIGEYKRQTFINSNANLPLWEETVSVVNPESRNIEWAVNKPKYGYYYRLSW